MTIGISRFLNRFKETIERKYDVDLRLLPDVDYSKNNTLAVYIDYNWRDLFREKLLKTIPFEQRVLLLIEPSNVNPTLYLVPWLRNRFNKVITWDIRLAAKDSRCFPTVVNPFSEPPDYCENRYSSIRFADKKLIVAVAGYRRNFMPWSNYRRRNSVYHYFDDKLPDDFDLYGNWWSPSEFKHVYRGPITTGRIGKIEVMCNYRFALCYENNAHQPGYVSEKISDCICARCVPIYYGSKGIEERVPPECFVNAKQFKSLDEMKDFIVSMTENEHQKYIDAMDRFCKSDLAKKFTMEYFVDCFAKALNLKPRIVQKGNAVEQ